MATKGPNTGGMGAYAPVLTCHRGVVDTAVDTIVKPILEVHDQRRASVPRCPLRWAYLDS